MNASDLDFFAVLGERLRTQDGLGTTHPVYQVRERREHVVDPSYHDPAAWVAVDKDGERLAVFTGARPDGLLEVDGVAVHDLRPVVYRWEPVPGKVALTQFGADGAVRLDGHNLDQPQVYVGSAHRVPELIRLREAVMAMNVERVRLALRYLALAEAAAQISCITSPDPPEGRHGAGVQIIGDEGLPVYTGDLDGAEKWIAEEAAAQKAVKP